MSTDKATVAQPADPEHRPSRLHQLLASIHEMAVNYYGGGDEHTQVVFGLSYIGAGVLEYSNLNYGHKVASFGVDSVLPSRLATGHIASWKVEIKHGSGKWGREKGIGKTPESALEALHRELLERHLLADAARMDAVKRARTLHPRRSCCDTTPGEEHLTECNAAPRADGPMPPPKLYEKRECCDARVNEPHRDVCSLNVKRECCDTMKYDGHDVLNCRKFVRRACCNTSPDEGHTHTCPVARRAGEDARPTIDLAPPHPLVSWSRQRLETWPCCSAKRWALGGMGHDKFPIDAPHAAGCPTSIPSIDEPRFACCNRPRYVARGVGDQIDGDHAVDCDERPF